MFKSVKAISAPSDANFKAMALPMPRAAPVTIATLPYNNFIINNLMVNDYTNKFTLFVFFGSQFG